MAKIAATMRGLNALKLQPKSSTIPADSNKLVTKEELNTYYYVDNVRAGISSYPNNRIVTYQDIRDGLFSKPSTPYYQYDVVRSGIPNANGAYFTYIGTDFQQYTVLENDYGYVGRFCMQENSYMNNQWNVYSFTQVGICYPSYGSYPQPYLSNGYLYFDNLYGYQIEDIKIHQIVDAQAVKDDTQTALQGGAGAIGAGTAIGLITDDNPNNNDEGLWAVVITFLTIAATEIFGNNRKATAQLRYESQGIYYNGSLSMAGIKLIGSSNQFYISYKVNSGYGYYAAIFGYGTNEFPPPLVTY